MDAARDLFQRSLSVYRELDHRQGIADSLSFLALVSSYRGDLSSARLLHEESLAIWIALDDRQATVWARTRLGAVLAQQADVAAAYEAFIVSLTTSLELDFRWGASWALDGLAQLAALHDEPLLALRLAVNAQAIRDAAGIRLPPLEQQDVDRLLERLRADIGSDAVAHAWSAREQQLLEELLRSVQEDLKPRVTRRSAPVSLPTSPC
jgi:hypothetical protein